MRSTLSLLAIFYAAFRQPLSPQWAQLQRSWRAFSRFWEQSRIHRELMRARLAIFFVLTFAGFALIGHMLGVETNTIMEFLIGGGGACACLAASIFSRTRKFEILASALLRFRIALPQLDNAIQSAARIFAATSENAHFVFVLARRNARIATAAVRTHVGTCALVLTPRIAAAPRFAAHIPAA